MIFSVVIVVIIVVIDDRSRSWPRSGTLRSRSVGSAWSVWSLLVPGGGTSLLGEAGLEQSLAVTVQHSAHPEQLDELGEVTARHVRPEV